MRFKVRVYSATDVKKSTIPTKTSSRLTLRYHARNIEAITNLHIDRQLCGRGAVEVVMG